MSYTKMVQLWCDGPGCRKNVIAETANAARHFAKYGQGWYLTRKYGQDMCSKECDEKWYAEYKEKQAKAELEAEVPAGTLEEAVSS